MLCYIYYYIFDIFRILFSASLNFVLRTVVVTKPLVSGIFYQHLQFFVCVVLIYLN